ncbi:MULTISPECIES: ABC transporter ATP-binding protein [unclassified Nocardioides]|uniref:ABC transporter ATP-binding protein n=1 Tax=unclassified Nocardioides TaxID=2615069 RepID=UPI003614D366
MNGPVSTPLLEVEDLTVQFGGVAALSGVSFSVHSQQICALIGPNGAGKTTAFNAISRLIRPRGGAIRFEGKSLLDRRAADLAGLGIARTFQNLALWPGMTVLENVMVGLHARGRVGFGRSLLGVPSVLEDRKLRARAFAALDYMQIADVANHACEGLPFGTLKRVELARALVSRPKLLLLDEPASGLTHGDVRELGSTLRQLRAELGLTLLLVEHHMALVMDLSDYVVALDFGRNLVSGRPEEVREDPKLAEAYLGRPA